jgi:hypothetical protein
MERRKSINPCANRRIFPQVILLPVLATLLIVMIGDWLFAGSVYRGYRDLLAECRQEYGVDCALVALPVAE